MLYKLFGSRKSKPIPENCVLSEERSSALKIIHAGGKTDYFYMAVPASRIMEKNPSVVIARPEVFRRPWDSVVRPEEILIPGQKFFVVPIRTVKKLKRRIRKPINDTFSTDSFVYVSSNDELTSKSYLPNGDAGKSKAKKQVRFIGTAKELAAEKQRNATRDGGLKKSCNSTKCRGEGKRRMKMITWEPSLTVIAECHDHPFGSIK